MTRVAFQRLCGLTSSTASRRLHQFVEAGKLRDIGTRHQSLYVAAREIVDPIPLLSQASQELV